MHIRGIRLGCLLIETLSLLLLLAVSAQAQSLLDIEAGLVFQARNDVRIPGDSGTRFSLIEDLNDEQGLGFRFRYLHTIDELHQWGFLAAPLTLEAKGRLERDIAFAKETFPSGSKVTATYRFDSYRIIYRYLAHTSDTFEFRIGGALKLRDAVIKLKSSTLEAEKENVGLVPLVSFSLLWGPYGNTLFAIDGEALAAPQGRAEDVLFAVYYKPTDTVSIKTGYRILEGGADNEEVFTFSLFNYFIFGAVWEF